MISIRRLLVASLFIACAPGFAPHIALVKLDAGDAAQAADSDGSVDGGTDAGDDAGQLDGAVMDAGSDAGSDAGVDGGVDAGASNDGGSDAGGGGSDAGDGGSDAGDGSVIETSDGSVDGGADAGGHAGADAGLDAGTAACESACAAHDAGFHCDVLSGGCTSNYATCANDNDCTAEEKCEGFFSVCSKACSHNSECPSGEECCSDSPATPNNLCSTLGCSGGLP